MKKKAFGTRLLSLRKEKGASQADVADYIGLTVAAYQNYENGRREAGYETISKLADFYNVTTDYLLGREPQANPLAGLNVKVNDDKFIEIYTALPEYAKKLFVDVMSKLAQAAEAEKKNGKVHFSSDTEQQDTYNCSELEDFQQEQASKQDVG